MLPVLLSALLAASLVHAEPRVNPLDVLTAMGVCVPVVEISPVGSGTLQGLATD
jgi:hypothetical protein